MLWSLRILVLDRKIVLLLCRLELRKAYLGLRKVSFYFFFVRFLKFLTYFWSNGPYISELLFGFPGLFVGIYSIIVIRNISDLYRPCTLTRFSILTRFSSGWLYDECDKMTAFWIRSTENVGFQIRRFGNSRCWNIFPNFFYFLVSSVGFVPLLDARASYFKEDWQAGLWICRAGFKSVIHGPVTGHRSDLETVRLMIWSQSKRMFLKNGRK